MAELHGFIHKYESFGAVDGPGIRFIVFMQGCPLECLYCHNSDSRCMNTGRKVTVDEVIAEVSKASNYFNFGGGITVSGGEALMQPLFLRELFTQAKARGWHTCLDTSGAYLGDAQKEVLALSDLVLLDIKSMNPAKHKKLTQWDLDKILNFARYLEEQEIPMWVRHVLVPTWTDTPEELAELGIFVSRLKNVDRFEILPFHKMGMHKWEERGLLDPLAEVPGATKEQVKKAKEILRSVGAKVHGD